MMLELIFDHTDGKRSESVGAQQKFFEDNHWQTAQSGGGRVRSHLEGHW
jgi:hypothetical protein